MKANLKIAQEFFNFFMKPMTVRHEVQHIKISGAITYSMFFIYLFIHQSASRFVTQLSYIKPERPSVFMVSINSAVGSMAAAQVIHNALKEASLNFNAPIYTFTEDFALGPAYYLLSLGNRVHANPFSLLGDFALHQKQIAWNRILKQNKISTQKIGQEGLLLDAYSEVTSKQEQFVNEQLNFELSTLIDQVKINRKDQLQEFSEDEIKNKILISKAFNADEALENGLIDEILTFEEFQHQNYQESKIQEISMRKGIREKILIRSTNVLQEEIEVILQKLKNPEVYLLNNDKVQLESQVKMEIMELMANCLKDEDSYQMLHDVMLEAINSQIVNNTWSDSKVLMI